MFFPVSRTLFRWSTPDPGDDWMMVGHLLISKEGIILVDPPVVPGISDAIKLLGKPEAVILTTGDHIRGSAFFSSEFDIEMYFPAQSDEDIDPGAALHKHHLRNTTEFEEGDELPGGIRPFRASIPRGKTTPNINEAMLLTTGGELLTGDIAMGSVQGKLLTRDEFFYSNPDPDDNASCLRSIDKVIRSTGARTLLSSHGFDIQDKLQEALNEKMGAHDSSYRHQS